MCFSILLMATHPTLSSAATVNLVSGLEFETSRSLAANTPLLCDPPKHQGVPSKNKDV